MAVPPAPPAPKAPVSKAVDSARLDRVNAIFCKVLDGTQYDAAIAKAIELEAKIASACAG